MPAVQGIRSGGTGQPERLCRESQADAPESGHGWPGETVAHPSISTDGFHHVKITVAAKFVNLILNKRNNNL